jgi:hypothetical protein
MSTTAKVTLPGIEYIGMPYDIRRQYASATSVNLGAPLFTITNANSFDPDTDPSVKIQIHQQDYYYPKDQFTVGTLNLQNTTQVEFTNAKEYSDKFSFGVEAGYQKAMFGGSVTSNFSASYDSSAYMVSVSRWALIRTYEVAMAYTVHQLQGMLTTEADADINGDMQPAAVINKYGTHVLMKAIFGGSNTYSQSVSKLNNTDSGMVTTAIEANYAGFNGKATGSYCTDTISTTSQSNAIFEAVGGDPAALEQSYEVWATSVTQQGIYGMVDFADESSLEPIASFARDPARQEALLEAMNKALKAQGSPIQKIYKLEWDPDTETPIIAGSKAKPDLTLGVESTSQVIVGYGAGINSKKVNRAVLHILDLATNILISKYFNDLTYMERDISVPNSVQDANGNPLRGVAMVGIKAYADSNNLRGLSVYYRDLNPADTSKTPTYLRSGQPQSAVWGGDSDVSYMAPEGWIITEIGLGMDGHADPIKVLNIKIAKLIQKAKSES